LCTVGEYPLSNNVGGVKHFFSTLRDLSATDTVPQSDHAVPEALLIEQLQLQPHTIREELFSGADYHREDDHLKFVNKTSS